ncbi:hypothetical protein C4E44_34850, partial [Pseudomonas sp. MWU12-2312b]
IMRFAKVRLPWGSADDLAPASALEKFSPKKLRLHEKSKKEREEKIAAGTYTSSSFEQIDFHIKDDHECFRYALLSDASHFWIYLYSIGRFLFWFSLFILLSTSALILINAGEDWKKTAFNLIKYSSITLGIPLAFWAVGKLVIDKFPNLWIKPSRGPIWELNRRTGLVTVFDYKNNGEYK